MKCTYEEYKVRCMDTDNVSIYDLIIKDKEDYVDFAKQYSCLGVLFSSLLKFIDNCDKICYQYVSINESLDLVISFLKNNFKDMYYRFMGILTNKQIHFVSYNDLPEIVSCLFDYIYNIINKYDLSIISANYLNQIIDIIEDNLCDSSLYDYLLISGIDVDTIVLNIISAENYESLKNEYIKNIVDVGVSSFATDNAIYICYNNTIKDAFNILHEFIHLDNLCPNNVAHVSPYQIEHGYVANRPYNFFLNEIPSIIMEEELYDYLKKNSSYDLSFYLPYRIRDKEQEIKGLYLPIMNMNICSKEGIYEEYLETVRYLYNSSENMSLMYMFTMESDNFDNRQLSYILGIIISMYTMTLNKDERINIFNYIRKRITSRDDYFTLFKNIGIDLTRVEDISKLVCSLYERYDTMKEDNNLVKKKVI